MSGTELERVVATAPVIPEQAVSVQSSAEDLTARHSRWEGLAIFAVIAVLYTVVGNWLLSEHRLVSFDVLEHFTRALMIWHNDPPKLAAIGWSGPPLVTAVLAPFALVPYGVSSLLVVPFASAVMAGFLFVVLNALMRRCGLDVRVRLALLAAFALNPLLLFQAATGRPQLIIVVLLAAAVSAVVGWYLSADVRFVLTAGILFGLALLADYGVIIWFVVAAILVAAVLARAGARTAEIEGTVVGLAAPLTYVAAIWVVMVAFALGNPLDAVERFPDAALSGSEIVGAAFALTTAASPLTWLVLPLLIASGLIRGDVLGLYLAGGIVLSVAAPALTAALRLTDTPMALHHGTTIQVMTLIGGVWLVRLAGERMMLAALGLLVALLASLPWVLTQMDRYPRQGMESNFVAVVRGGDSQEGATTRGGQRVGIDDELAMAAWIEEHIDGTGSVLTDDAETYAVILFTGRPDLFLDRIDIGDDKWRDAVTDPPESVTHLLISDASGDLLREAYPGVFSGEESTLTEIYRSGRYVLVAAPGQAPAAPTSTDPGGTP